LPVIGFTELALQAAVLSSRQNNDVGLEAISKIKLINQLSFATNKRKKCKKNSNS
jgi:hypothetical protein